MTKPSPLFKDETTGLPVLPFGRFSVFAPYARSSKLPEQYRHLPVLVTGVDASKLQHKAGLPCHAGYGTVQVGSSLALTFRVQCGPNLLFMFANAFDRDVWRMTDRWDSARQMVLVIETSPGAALVVARDYSYNANLKAIREFALSKPGLFDAKQFAEDIGTMMLKGEARLMTTSDIPQFPAFKNVEARMVLTELTGAVAFADAESVGATTH